MADFIGKIVGWRRGTAATKRKSTRPQRGRRLGFESLEDRRVLSGSPVSGSIASIQTNQGTQTDVFAIGTDHQVYLETSNGLGGWNAWTLTQAGTVKEIAAAHDGAGNLHLFAIRDDNQVYQEVLQNGVWSAWSLTQAGYASDIAAQANVAPGSSLQLFIIGSDSQVYSESTTSSGSWSPLALTRAGTAKQISVMMDSVGETHVFAIGADNQVWTEHSITGGTWSVWTLTQTGIVQEISAPTATTAQSPVKVVAVGEDGQVYVETSANNWKGWTLTQPGTSKGITSFNNSAGTTIVFSINSDQQVYEELSNNPWSPWKLTAAGTFLGGDIVNSPASSLSINTGAAVYDPGGLPILVAPDATLSIGDGEFANSVLTVTDKSPYVNDRLSIWSSGALVVSGNALIFNGTMVGTFTAGRTVTVTFNGTATQNAIQAVAQHITFTNIVSAPMLGNRTISVALKVGSLGYPASTTQTVELISSTSTTVGGPAVTYNPGEAPIAIAPAATLTTGSAMANSSLKVTDTSPYLNDRLGIQSSGALVVSGTTLIYNGTAVGTFTTGRTVTVTFNTNATQGAVLAVMQNITFISIVPSPMIANRPISFELKAGSSGFPVTMTQTVQLVPATVLNVAGPAVTYGSGAAPVVVASAATLSTGGLATANSTLTVVDTSAYVNDRLTIQSAGPLVVSGSTLTYDGITIGSFTAGRTVTVTFNGNATQAGILAVIQNIEFNNIVAKPMLGNRTISFRLKTGSSGYVVTSNATISVVA
ncbi:MAG TPA: hypothetical protein VGN12_26820 [Pirellulales bacterium]